jgi:hypothetical protein
MPAVDLSALFGGVPGTGVNGWPILPHGGGSSYNNFSWYMGSSLPPQTRQNVGINYGEYMPQEGTIFGAAVNWTIRHTSGKKYRIMAVNYGPSALGGPTLPNWGINVTTGSAPLFPTYIPISGPGSRRGSNSRWRNFPFSAGDYIGIYITYGAGTAIDPFPKVDDIIPDPIEIEGTIYFRFNNIELESNASNETKW